MSHLGAQVSLEQMEGSALSLLCGARRLALNALCPRDGDWHTRSQTQPIGRELRDSPRWLQARGSGCRGRDPVTQETPELTLGRHWPVLGISRSVGLRASRPCTALPSHLGEAGGEAHGGLTGMQQPWNCLELVLCWGETTVF